MLEFFLKGNYDVTKRIKNKPIIIPNSADIPDMSASVKALSSNCVDIPPAPNVRTYVNTIVKIPMNNNPNPIFCDFPAPKYDVNRPVANKATPIPIRSIDTK